MLKVGIVGVTGYTGMELIRILHNHPEVEITYASSLDNVGKKIGEAVPHLGKRGDLIISAFDVGDAARAAGFFFVCLPHGVSMDIVAPLREAGSRVVDLSADFRIADVSVYEHWYGKHRHKELIAGAVYGMPELYRDRIRTAGLVANPGCYPTSVILGLAPLIAGGIVDALDIVIDSKSGISGAGREPSPGVHFPEAFGNFSAYNIAGRHRHISEMEQELGTLAGNGITITFSPHLIPVSRGILSTIYCKSLGRSLDDQELHRIFTQYYSGEPFVRISGPGSPLPSLKDVRGTNDVFIGFRSDNRTGRITIVSTLDNLVKGASGQAVQNMNLMAGFPEKTGLDLMALHP
jgi:N-acetyl-gamma-glutamyl-phosphate reductase